MNLENQIVTQGIARVTPANCGTRGNYQIGHLSRRYDLPTEANQIYAHNYIGSDGGFSFTVSAGHDEEGLVAPYQQTYDADGELVALTKCYYFSVRAKKTDGTADTLKISTMTWNEGGWIDGIMFAPAADATHGIQVASGGEATFINPLGWDITGVSDLQFVYTGEWQVEIVVIGHNPALV